MQDIMKIPPQAIEIEEAILGALLIEPKAIDNVIDILKIEMFYKTKHQIIFESILKLNKNNNPIDILTVTEFLVKENKIDTVGGAFYITKLTLNISSSVHLNYHVKIVQQKFIQRELIKISSEIQNQCFNGEDISDVLNFWHNESDKINNIFTQNNEKTFIENIELSIFEAKKRQEFKDKGMSYGITTGLKELDKLTNGWQKNNLIIIASRPGMGKTAMCLMHAKEAAKKGFTPCVFSLEMSAINLTDRLIISDSGINADKYMSGYLNENEWDKINNTKKELSNYDILINDKTPITIDYIRSNSKLKQKKGKCDIIIIDYLQLADSGNINKNYNKVNEITEISRKCKLLAKELNIPVLLLSQLNRAVELRNDKRPILSDLRDSGAIEQDADMVIFIYRPAYYGITDGENDFKNYGELMIAKNRNGANKIIPFWHNESLTKIKDYGQEDLPEFDNKQSQSNIDFNKDLPF